VFNMKAFGSDRSRTLLAVAVGLYVVANAWLAFAAGHAAAGLAHAIVGVILLAVAVSRSAGRETCSETESSSAPRTDSLPDVRFVRVLASIIDSEDPYTSGRSYRVSRFSLRIAREFDLPPGELETIELAALLHDVGRAAIRHDVFKQMFAKRGRLTDRERALMSTHPQTGYYILRELPSMLQAAEIIRSHHEQPDGKGYPDGLRGDAIPFGSRVIMVAAAFDAMTSDRPYRSGMAPARACAELQKGAGTMFDTRVVETLIALYESGALFDDIDRGELELHSSFHGRSLAVEEFLARKGGQATPEPEGATPGLADLEIDLGLDTSRREKDTGDQSAA
jgi:putative nucleotidyltransferase with HDIG domain